MYLQLQVEGRISRIDRAAREAAQHDETAIEPTIAAGDEDCRAEVPAIIGTSCR
jgi:hypothetical protein